MRYLIAMIVTMLLTACVSVPVKTLQEGSNGQPAQVCEQHGAQYVGTWWALLMAHGYWKLAGPPTVTTDCHEATAEEIAQFRHTNEVEAEAKALQTQAGGQPESCSTTYWGTLFHPRCEAVK